MTDISAFLIRYRTHAIGVATFLFCNLVLAQIPGLPGIGETPAKDRLSNSISAGAVSNDASLAAELRNHLAEVQKQHELLSSANGLGTGAPAGTPEMSLQQRQLRTAFVVRTLVQQLVDIDKLAAVRSKRSILEEKLNAFSGLAEKPPYSIFLADQLRIEYADAKARIDGLNLRTQLLQQSRERALDYLKKGELQLRQITEQAEKARDDNAGERIAWAREQAKQLISAANTAIGANETARQLLHEMIAVAQIEVELARRKLEIVTPDMSFTAEDLERLHSTLETDRGKLEKLIERLTRQYPAMLKGVNVSQLAFESAREASLKNGNGSTEALDKLQRLEQDQDLKQARLDALSAELEHLRETADLNRTRESLWDSRYAVFHKKDADTRMVVREATEKLLGFLDSERKHFEQQHKAITKRIVDVDIRIERLENFSIDGFLNELRKVYVEHAESLQRTLAALETNETLSHQIITETGGGKSDRSLVERSQEWGFLFKRYAMAVWDFELIAIEDTIEIEGKSITGKRSVTIGKTLYALLLVAAGYMLTVFLARFGERTLVKRFSWLPAHAGIVRSWVLAIGVVIVTLAVLSWVKIPFTIFAFLGGAIAIGLGFGMQTLLKNLISGMMILGEQPFRIGDLVEVSGVRGTITNMGLRASTIIDVNGIETIIPNSTFIEQNLTNWMHTSGYVRFNVNVGIAYGSPVRVATQLLADVANRHGQVLKEPPPEVLFEEFASDSLNFTLYYWLDMSSGVSARRVASDLRLMIEAGFTSNEIVIAFPQRDVHLDASTPLPIRIVSEDVPKAKAESESSPQLP